MTGRGGVERGGDKERGRQGEGERGRQGDIASVQ